MPRESTPRSKSELKALFEKLGLAEKGTREAFERLGQLSNLGKPAPPPTRVKIDSQSYSPEENSDGELEQHQ